MTVTTRPPAKADRQLSKDDFEMVKMLEPVTAMMMLRQRVYLTNYGKVSIKSWLSENTKGLFFVPYDSMQSIWFELDEDLVLFIAAFQGKEVNARQS